MFSSFSHFPFSLSSIASERYHRDSDFVIAIDSAMYANGANCGRKVQITRTDNGKVGFGVVQDECPTCDNGTSLDLSTGFFNSLGAPSEGIVRSPFVFPFVSPFPSSRVSRLVSPARISIACIIHPAKASTYLFSDETVPYDLEVRLSSNSRRVLALRLPSSLSPLSTNTSYLSGFHSSFIIILQSFIKLDILFFLLLFNHSTLFNIHVDHRFFSFPLDLLCWVYQNVTRFLKLDLWISCSPHFMFFFSSSFCLRTFLLFVLLS